MTQVLLSEERTRPVAQETSEGERHTAVPAGNASMSNNHVSDPVSSRLQLQGCCKAASRTRNMA